MEKDKINGNREKLLDEIGHRIENIRELIREEGLNNSYLN